MNTYTLKVNFRRFSTMTGYGYNITTRLFINGDYPDSKIIAIKSLHCNYGDNSADQENWININHSTMTVLGKFCEKCGNFWNCEVSKEITPVNAMRFIF
jgi:hypothetical protein